MPHIQYGLDIFLENYDKKKYRQPNNNEHNDQLS